MAVRTEIRHTLVVSVVQNSALRHLTKAGHGTTKSLPVSGWSASPNKTQVWTFWKRKKENIFLNCKHLRAEYYSWDYVLLCLSHYLLFVSPVSITPQTQSQSNSRTSCQKLSYGGRIFNKNESYTLYLTCCTFRRASEHERPKHNVRAISLQPGQMNKWKRNSGGGSLGCTPRLLSPWQG